MPAAGELRLADEAAREPTRGALVTRDGCPTSRAAGDPVRGPARAEPAPAERPLSLQRPPRLAAARRPRPTAPAADERATARKVFEAKVREPNPPPAVLPGGGHARHVRDRRGDLFLDPAAARPRRCTTRIRRRRPPRPRCRHRRRRRPLQRQLPRARRPTRFPGCRRPRPRQLLRLRRARLRPPSPRRSVRRRRPSRARVRNRRLRLPHARPRTQSRVCRAQRPRCVTRPWSPIDRPLG